MHYLHKILVYIPDALADADNCDLDETISAVRAYADSETEPYYGQAFDWRETETAGRWRNVYPENVLLAADDVDYFVEELENAKRNQCNEIDCCLAELKRTVGINLEKIINGILIRGSYEEELNGFNFMTPYYLHNISSHLHGDYRCDSYFFNSHDYTSRLYPTDFEKIKSNPTDWALVVFDYHN